MEWIRTGDMEPHRPPECTTSKDDLRPQPPPLIVSLERRRRPIADDETEHGTDPVLPKTPNRGQQKIRCIRNEFTYTVSNVDAIDNGGCLGCWLLMTVTKVAQAPKKMRICQHLKMAVARTAETNDEPGRERGANLH
jgi:hypothetical protein